MAKATNKEPAMDKKDKASKSTGKDSKKKGKEAESVSGPAQLQQFIKDSWGEFLKIQWPTPRQAANESVVVLITVIFIIALVNFYDWIATSLLSFILVK